MSLSNLRWPHWWMLAIVIGLAVGFLRRSEDDDLRGLGAGLNSQFAFENALTTTLDGQPLFHHLTVSTRKIHDGDGVPRTVDIVRGLYCDGQPDPIDHKLHWRPTFFIAAIPYHAPQNETRITTVRGYLDGLARSGKIHYTSAWWESYPVLTSVGASLLFLGLLFPALINMLVHKTLVPARPASLFSLRGIAGTASKGNAPLPTAPELQMSVDDEISVATSNDATESQPQAPVDPQIRRLNTDCTRPTPEQSESETVFAARPDDYYPTCRRQPREG